jgi:uncharacterized protein (DUF924 family)
MAPDPDAPDDDAIEDKTTETRTPEATTPDDVLDFWLGALDPQGQADAAHAARWFAKDDAFDQEIAARFGALYDAVAKRQHEDWLATPRGRLAYVIVLDQFSRNMFRGSPRTFERDGQALAAAQEGVARGDDKRLGLDERSFLYLPFMHSEELAMQDRAVALFTALVADAPPELKEKRTAALGYAQKHRDIIARFGRFPHRNTTLGRTSTGDEWEFLKQPGSGF